MDILSLWPNWYVSLYNLTTFSEIRTPLSILIRLALLLCHTPTLFNLPVSFLDSIT